MSSASEIRKYTPVYRPVSLKEPSDLDRKIDNCLRKYMDVEMPLESDEEMMRRDAVLMEVRKIFVRWVKFIATEVLHMPDSGEEEEEDGGEMFISGSHRLGVRDIGADIDTVCVAPQYCTREHFFSHLKNSFLQHPDVTELVAVADAFVPIMSFDLRGVSIDLLFARLADNYVPRDLDILDDKILTGVDVSTEKSLNGPRVTNMIFKLVGEKTFPNFLIVLRCVRKWAKKRGLYGNKLGYLGGVNCNILVAFVCQLYPNAGPSSLLLRFFKLYGDWNWPEPVMLNSIQSNPPDAALSDQRDVWSAEKYPHHIMPIITPAYPAMNSSVNVSSHTLEIMTREIKRGYGIMKEILETLGTVEATVGIEASISADLATTQVSAGGQSHSSPETPSALSETAALWGKLFEPSDFFLRYSHYLVCHIVGTGDDPESRSWVGFVESRIRRFIQYPFLETLPLKMPIQLYPIMSKTQKSSNSECYFIGFDLDLELISKLPDKGIHIDECVYRFQESLWDPERGFRGVRKEGLDFYVEHLPWKRLPKEVFEAVAQHHLPPTRDVAFDNSDSNNDDNDQSLKKPINLKEFARNLRQSMGFGSISSRSASAGAGADGESSPKRARRGSFASPSEENGDIAAAVEAGVMSSAGVTATDGSDGNVTDVTAAAATVGGAVGEVGARESIVKDGASAVKSGDIDAVASTAPVEGELSAASSRKRKLSFDIGLGSTEESNMLDKQSKLAVKEEKSVAAAAAATAATTHAAKLKALTAVVGEGAQQIVAYKNGKRVTCSLESIITPALSRQLAAIVPVKRKSMRDIPLLLPTARRSNSDGNKNSNSSSNSFVAGKNPPISSHTLYKMEMKNRYRASVGSVPVSPVEKSSSQVSNGQGLAAGKARNGVVVRLERESSMVNGERYTSPDVSWELLDDR